MTSAYDKLLKEDTPGVRYRRVRSLVKIVRVYAPSFTCQTMNDE
jgi:hypothetical protein